MMKWLAPLAAWNTPFDPALHCKNQFEVFDFVSREAEEGDVIRFTFETTVKNVHMTTLVGLNQQYFVYSERAEDDVAPRQVIRGRVNVVPIELGDVTAKLEFIAVPPREDLVLRAAAMALRVGEVEYDADAAPEDRYDDDRYDPAFFDLDAILDPTTAILARNEFWRFDPITLLPELVSISDGRTEHVVPSGLRSGGISLQVNNPPKPVTRLRVSAQFAQRNRARQDFNRIKTIRTYTFDDLQSSMPKAGDPIGSDTGWTFDSIEVTDVTPAATSLRVQANSANYGDAAGSYLHLRAKEITVNWRAYHDYEQAREEILDIEMPVALERPVADELVETVEVLQLGDINADHVTPYWEYEHPDTLIRKHYKVGDSVQYNGRRFTCLVEHDATPRFSMWWGIPKEKYWSRAFTKLAPQADRRLATYFGTNRGKRSMRYAVNRLRRIVTLRARCAVLTFPIPYLDARSMSCADTIRIEAPRVGEVVGKIISIERRIDNRGQRIAQIQIAAANGDGTLPPEASENQEQTGDLAYSTTFGRLYQPVNAVGLDTIGPYADIVDNDATAQEAIAREAATTGLDPIAAIGANPTRWTIAFPSLREEDLLARRITLRTVPLRLPKQIRFTPE
ncbi:hypothetical protein ASD54_08675 [Rhizobium sp. Root149]|uniref:carbohydrate-binding protein n=1 Tax=Rhizobium sp. Root149 TaxID=1736473 RepID=UPI0007162C71|nr:carbohydrate-binding protein [Rhizobium sp. Root149]KQZ50319.1 hypothetical protein ASD54_08675 [Rhizobium sp. Root149]